MTLLATLIIHIGYPETRRVAFGPLEVTASTPLAYGHLRNTDGKLIDVTLTGGSESQERQAYLKVLNDSFRYS